jgi:hypothetical protein
VCCQCDKAKQIHILSDRINSERGYEHIPAPCFKYIGNVETLGRPRRRWEDNIKMDHQKVGGGGGDWMERAQDRDRWRTFVSTVMNFRVP